MKILYVSQYFPPEMGAPAARAAELACHWTQTGTQTGTQAGHQVSILTGFPNHPTGMVPPEWRKRLRRLSYFEKAGHVDVYRTWLWPLPNRKAHERMRNYASFCVSSGLRGLALPRPDVIIGTSPQLLVALSACWLAFARRVPFVFEVRDLWPESLIAVGASHDKSLLNRALAAIAGFLYRRSDHIVVVSPAFRKHLVDHWNVPSDKISVVENGVEASLFAPSAESERTALRAELGIEGKFLACYIGTMGMAHGLETLLDAASLLQSRGAQMMFLLIGEGSEKQRIKELAEARNLKNVRFLDQQPRETIPRFISASDACLVLLRKTEVFKTVIPTKMLEFMSCARPVILAAEGQSQSIIEEAGGGLVIQPENADALAEAVMQLARSPEICQASGRKGREYVLRNFSRSVSAETYIRVLERLLGQDRERTTAAAA